MGASERLYHSQGRECGLGGLPGKRSRDAFPVTPYHTLIIPKRHVLDYFGLKHRKCMFDNVQTLSVGMDMKRDRNCRWIRIFSRFRSPRALRGSAGTFSNDLERQEPPRRREIFGGCSSGPMRIALGYELTIGQLRRSTGLCEQEALSGNASEREQRGNLGLELDSFRHRIEPQRLAQSDDGARQFRPGAGVGQTVDEGPVDLENVDRKAVQVR